MRKKFGIILLTTSLLIPNMALASKNTRANLVTRSEEVVVITEKEEVDIEVDINDVNEEKINEDIKTSSNKPSSTLHVPIKPGEGIRISSGYGVRVHPILGKKAMHWGIDIAAPIGTAIYSIADGEVVSASPNGTAGNEIKIKHSNGMVTRYLHMSKRTISKGDKVEAGQLIGTVGNTGRSTGYHLHFEVKINGKNIDPSKLFSK